jgi:Nucleotidyl transferase AbiEii toxin, Type IV TA system
VHPFHERLARVGLAAAAPYGFCLAGGYAVQAHGMVDRRSKDVDLFTSTTAADKFPSAVDAVLSALREDGLDVSVSRRGTTFARLQVVDPTTGEPSVMELGVDWRAYPPVKLAIGPVLHPDDAVANKVCALFGRAEVRDYVDVNGALCSGRYTGEDLLRLAADHDPGFDRDIFADALRAVRRFPHSAYQPYALSESEIGLLRARLLDWADEISGRRG